MREQREQAERQTLAAFAVTTAQSRGRRYAEPPHPVRMCFERDRDRVIHSRCFRRLEYKAQVFVNGTADHYRTRLTHTIEAAAVSRTLARYFRVQEDLTEAIVLAHDVGHTPFGHCGEFALNELMRDHGGFDHNRQSLRWVEFLEAQYPGFPGLNLTWETRAGLMKHETRRPEATLDAIRVGPRLFAEAQIADIADDITYCAHDTDDAIEAGLLHEQDLAQEPLWQRAVRQTDDQYVALDNAQHCRITVRNLLDILVHDVMCTGTARLADIHPASDVDVMNAPHDLIGLGDEASAQLQRFRGFLQDHVYRNPAVMTGTQHGVRMIGSLFRHYVAHPEDMGGKARARIGSEGLERTVCDYVSGFTDRYAIEECRRLGLGGMEKETGNVG